MSDTSASSATPPGQAATNAGPGDRAAAAAATEPAHYEAATGVKAALLARLAGDERLRGVGVSRNPESGGFQVEVRCADQRHIAELGLPPTVDGVRVLVRAVGDVTAAAAD